MITKLQAMMDDEFQKIIQNDEVINYLEKQKNNLKLEFWQVRNIISPIFKIDGFTVSCITPAIWSMLYCLGNGFCNQKEVTESDIDLFFYFLHKGILNIGQNFLEEADGYVGKLGLNYDSVKMDIFQLINIAFAPTSMIPQKKLNSDADLSGYGADWLTFITSIASKATNRKSSDVMFNMSLTQCHYHLINKLKETDTKNEIKKRNSSQIQKMIFDRVQELGQIYYNTNYGEQK